MIKLSSPYINRFVQPDTIIPDLSNPQSWNRYSYVTNNPLRYTDPTGHIEACDKDDWACQYHWEILIIPPKEKPKFKVPEHLLKPNPNAFIEDAYDTCVVSQFGACPPVTSFFPWLSEGTSWTLEHGAQIIGGAADIISDGISIVRPQVTPTPFFVSPTVSSTSTLALPNATVTITPYSTNTATMTLTVSPTPSATLVYPTGTFTSFPPTPTIQYRVP